MSATTPTPTEHGRLRYTQRAGLSGPSIRRAWDEGEPVELGDHRHYETARIHEETGVVLLARDQHIITVLVAAHEELKE